MIESLRNFVLVTYLLVLCGLLIYVFHTFVMIILYRKNSTFPQKIKKKLDFYPFVTIQLPVYNEQYVIERLISAVCKIQYPKEKMEIQILDDSTDETTEIARKIGEKYRKQGFDIKLYHRNERKGYKAGALREGLAHSKGDFIALFDADFIPPTEFLLTTLPYFMDEKVAAVQGRWGHLNDSYSFLTRGQALGLDAHFVIEQTVRNRNGAFINFNGTGGIWRREAILDAGNWEYDTLTEDLDLSYRAQLKGWEIIYLKDLICYGEIPTDINGLKIQQHRWAKGAVQTAKKILPKVLRSPLPLFTKFEAFVHLTNHFTYPLVLLITLLSVPLIMIKVNCIEARTYFNYISFFTIFVVIQTLFYFYGQREIYTDWKRRLWYIPALFAWGIGTCVVDSKAVFEGLLGIKTPFNRTPKYRIEKKSDSWKDKKYKSKFNWLTIIELFLATYTAYGTVYSIVHSQFFITPFMFLLSFSFLYTGTLSLVHNLKG